MKALITAADGERLFNFASCTGVMDFCVCEKLVGGAERGMLRTGVRPGLKIKVEWGESRVDCEGGKGDEEAGRGC